MKRNPNSIRKIDIKYDEGRDTYSVSFTSNRNKPKGEYHHIYFDQLSDLIAGKGGLGVESIATEKKVWKYCNRCGYETEREEGESCPYHQSILEDGTFLWDEFNQDGESKANEVNYDYDEIEGGSTIEYHGYDGRTGELDGSVKKGKAWLKGPAGWVVGDGNGNIVDEGNFISSESKANEYGDPLIGSWDEGGWFFGIPNMTRDDYEGSVYWKGVRVEHYDHDYFGRNDDNDNWVNKMRQDAKELERKILELEAKNIPVNMSSVLASYEGKPKKTESKANEDFPQVGTPNYEFLWKHFDFKRSMDQDDIECKLCGYWLRPQGAYRYEEEIMSEAKKHMVNFHLLGKTTDWYTEPKGFSYEANEVDNSMDLGLLSGGIPEVNATNNEQCEICGQLIDQNLMDYHVEQEHGLHVPSQYTQDTISQSMGDPNYDHLEDWRTSYGESKKIANEGSFNDAMDMLMWVNYDSDEEMYEAVAEYTGMDYEKVKKRMEAEQRALDTESKAKELSSKIEDMKYDEEPMRFGDGHGILEDPLYPESEKSNEYDAMKDVSFKEGGHYGQAGYCPICDWKTTEEDWLTDIEIHLSEGHGIRDNDDRDVILRRAFESEGEDEPEYYDDIPEEKFPTDFKLEDVKEEDVVVENRKLIHSSPAGNVWEDENGYLSDDDGNYIPDHDEWSEPPEVSYAEDWEQQREEDNWEQEDVVVESSEDDYEWEEDYKKFGDYEEDDDYDYAVRSADPNPKSKGSNIGTSKAEEAFNRGASAEEIYTLVDTKESEDGRTQSEDDYLNNLYNKTTANKSAGFNDI